MAKGSNRFNRIMKKGFLQEKKEQMDKLEIEIDNLVKDINYDLTLLTIDDIDEKCLKSAKVSMDNLQEKCKEYLKLKEESEELE